MKRMKSSSTRRQFLGLSVRTAAAFGLYRGGLLAQESGAQPAMVLQGRAAAATAKIKTQGLRRNVSVLMGSGGNIAVLPGADGKLLIDCGYLTSQQQITDALSALSADPVSHLIDTHWHVDHTDGNEWLHAAGATIVAQDNTRKWLSTTKEIAAFHARFPPAPAGALPTVTFAEKHTLKLNGDTLLLSHYAPAHTDGDIAIYFSEADVLHTGDTWFNGMYPFLDASSGGSIDGMIAAANHNLRLASGATMIIPGHGPVGDRAQLTASRDMLVAVRDKVAKLKKQGKSLDEVNAAKPSADYDERWGGGFMKPEVFVALVYQGV